MSLIQFKPNDIDLLLTNKCNLKCLYCDTTYSKETHESKFRLDILNKLYPVISKANIVSVSGGEPGTLDINIVDKLCNFLRSVTVNHKILYTNGVFLDRYLDYANTFNKIVIHIAPEIDDKTIHSYLSRYNDIEVKDVDITFRIVVHRHNYNYILQRLFQLNQLFKGRIEVVPFVSDVKFLIDKFSLTIDQIEQLYHYCKKHRISYLFLDSNHIARNIPMYDKQLRYMCFMWYSNIVIDFPHERIIRCCWLKNQQSIPFAKIEEADSDSVLRLVCGKFDYDQCKACTHLTVTNKSLMYIKRVNI